LKWVFIESFAGFWVSLQSWPSFLWLSSCHRRKWICLHGITANNCTWFLYSPFDNFRLYLDHIEFYALVRVYLLMLTWLRFVYVLLSQVLHMDRNDYYGGESASLNLIQVWLFTICICQSLAVFLLLTTLVSDRFWLWINLFTALEEVQGKR
jgi:hypothetical protein